MPRPQRRDQRRPHCLRPCLVNVPKMAAATAATAAAAGCWSMWPGWRRRAFHYCFFFAQSRPHSFPPLFLFYFVAAAALFLARVPFCAYAILVYLLAILLAMNLFVFIVKPAAELPQNTNKQQLPPWLPCPIPHSHIHLAVLKGYRLPLLAVVVVFSRFSAK